MKKIWALALAAAMALSLTACGGGSSDTPSESAAALQLGDTGSAGDWSFTLTDVEFCDAMADDNNGLYYLRPADEEYKSAAGHSFYTAGSGNVYLFFTAELSYKGKETAEIGNQSENSISFELQYGDGYSFDATEFAIADSQGADGSNLYTFDTAFEPLGAGRECRGYFEVPLEVQDSEANPLALAVTFMDLDGNTTELVYAIR